MSSRWLSFDPNIAQTNSSNNEGFKSSEKWESRRGNIDSFYKYMIIYPHEKKETFK